MICQIDRQTLDHCSRYSDGPNSPGSFYVRGVRDVSVIGSASGSFSQTADNTAWENVSPANAGTKRFKVDFDPSTVSSYYGASDKPQVDAAYSMMLIRSF